MYTQGTAVPVVLGTATTATVLPVTGMTNIVEIALAAAAGLAVWGAVYMGMSLYGKR